MTSRSSRPLEVSALVYFIKCGEMPGEDDLGVFD